MRKADRQQLPHEACVLLWDYQTLSVDDKVLLFRKFIIKEAKATSIIAKIQTT